MNSLWIDRNNRQKLQIATLAVHSHKQCNPILFTQVSAARPLHEREARRRQRARILDSLFVWRRRQQLAASVHDRGRQRPQPRGLSAAAASARRSGAALVRVGQARTRLQRLPVLGHQRLFGVLSSVNEGFGSESTLCNGWLWCGWVALQESNEFIS